MGRGDLADSGWIASIGVPSFDAVFSTTALHRLPVEPLVLLYRDLGQLVPEDGVVLKGDNLAFASHQERLRLLAEVAVERQHAEAFDGNGLED